MNPITRRFIITFVVTLAAGVLVSVVFFSPKPPPPSPVETAAQPEGQPEQSQVVGDEAVNETPAPDQATPDQPGDEGTDTPTRADPPATSLNSTLEGLHAKASDRGRLAVDGAASSLGSLDPNADRMLIEFNHIGAGMKRITFSDVWLTARSKRQAEAHHKALRKGAASPPPLPDDKMRYVLQQEMPYSWISPTTGAINTTEIPVLAAQSILVNGQRINLANSESWAEIEPGEFESFVLNEANQKILTINRKFTLDRGYDFTLDQRITNHTDQPLTIVWQQYGPGDLFVDRARYIDRRRFRFGYLHDPVSDPNREFVFLDDKILYERMSLQGRYKKILKNSMTAEKRDELRTLWPNDTSIKNQFELSSFASTNRYFALAIHPPLDDQGNGPRYFSHVVNEIEYESVDPGNKYDRAIFTYLYSPRIMIAPGGTLALDMGVYAGPLDPAEFKDDARYKALSLRGLILYQMSSMCAICTWQWLAIFLLWFLSLVDAILLDWGVAIILLVVVVRTLLHPITKKSQINMRLFAEKTQALKPELDKLDKKFPNDPKRLQQEKMRFMREHNMNPLSSAFGCMPMFLQMPIWVALYAMLYFAFELRQEPAFYGIFQTMWDWPFLADLSAADHFFGEFATPKTFWVMNFTGINLLPLLMGVIFFFQQKYMTPPPSPTMSKEQIQQQKIMKVMMVVMFPVMLYNAPSGLTLYILTSTTIGIIESKYIRSHIDELDLKKAAGAGKSDTTVPKKGKKSKDPQGRAFSEAIERAKKKNKGPEKQFKKRK